ncbi:phosphopantetheine-binding protein [Actinoplanes oblitus]|uniref:Phosphopantetheine-binding protein n=1 Tax=Actinoplanes oblitus TaxID=3040509 RepID=A0ABY8WBA6_9ACTN|nr:phosphopantetheine-binding protein [Actinoplanes oblitus]WIM94411.1 phosphopantetheine-binding protein [Actinoplanes oblitus]
MSDELRGRVREFVATQAPGADVDDDDDLFASGLVNSLFAVQLVLWLEQTFDVRVESHELVITTFATVSSIADFVARKQAGPAVARGL